MASGRSGTLSQHRASSEPVGSQRPEIRSFDERREVTALFYDLIDSTRLLSSAGLERYQELLAELQSCARAVVSDHGGTVRETLGDGGVAIFGSRADAEESAVAAVLAGLDLVSRYRRGKEVRARDLHLRVGIATSEVIVVQEDPGREEFIGTAPNLASRLQKLAPPDGVVISERTRRLAGRRCAYRSLGTQEIQGFPDPAEVWQAAERRAPTDRFVASANLRGPMMGRDADLGLAMECWRRAEAGTGHVLVIEGEAGIGKSRLAHEIFRRTKPGRGRLLVFQCAPGGESTPFLALAHRVAAETARTGAGAGALSQAQLRSLLRRQDIASAKVAQVLGYALGASGRSDAAAMDLEGGRLPARLDWAVRHCLARWTRDGPLLLAIEDFHWIDPSSRGLIERLAHSIAAMPVLLVITSRRPVLITGLPQQTTLHLGALKPSETSALIARLWPAAGRERQRLEMMAQLHRRTGGVPLFIEEACHWLSGHPAAAQESREALIAEAPISSLEKILSARLASMGPAKRLVQTASVIGRTFHRSLLQGLLPEIDPASVSAALRDLVEARILLRGRAGDYAFRHASLQESLYRMLLGRTRAELHRRIYQEASRRDPASATQLPMLAWHAEEGGLPGEAIGLYAEAGRQAFARSASQEARQQLEHALSLVERLPAGETRERLELTVIAALGPVLTSTEGTRSAMASRLYERAVQLARRRPTGERATLFPVFWGWWYTGGDFAIQRRRAEAVTRDLRDVADPEVRLQAQHCAWAIDFNLGRHKECVAAVDAGLDLYVSGHGRETFPLYGGHDARVCGLGQKGLSLWLQGRPAEALRSVEASLAWAQQLGHVGSIAHAYDIAAMLHRYRSDREALLAAVDGMKRLARRHDLPSLRAKAKIYEGWSAGRAGDGRRGRRLIESGFAIQREIGTREDFPVYSEMLADLLVRAGALEAARRLIDEAIGEARRTSHSYWLPVLYWRRARIGLERRDASASAWLRKALQCAHEQDAAGLVLRIFAEAAPLGGVGRLTAEILGAVALAARTVQQDGEMVPLLVTVQSALNAAGGPR